MKEDYVIHHETYTHKNGKKYDVRWYYDNDSGPPDMDCHGVVESLDWNPTNEEQLEQHIMDNEDEEGAGLELEEETRLRMMRVLRRPERRFDSGLYYDVMSSLEKARTEWGCATAEEAMKQVERDYAYLKGYFDEDWHYVTLSVALIDEDGEVDEDSRGFCGGYESTIMNPRNDEERSWRVECIEDKIAEIEWQIKKQLHKGQMELEL